MHISSLDDVGCKHLTSGDVRFKIVHLLTSQYPCNLILYTVRIEIIFLTGELSRINTCVVGQIRILIHSGLRRRELIFRDLPSNNIGIKHGFPFINVCQVPREVLKTEAEGRGFKQLPRDLANVNALENHV